MTRSASEPPGELHRLVAGADFSEGSAAALRLAVSWARLLEVPLDLLHATGDDVDVEALGPALDRLLAESLELARAHELSTPVSARVVSGRPVEALVDAVRGAPAAWLVVGCEGTGASLVRRGGHVAARLALGSPVPVLIASAAWRPSAGRRGREPARAPTRILVGLAGDERDGRLLVAGAALARSHRAELAVAHVVDVSNSRHYPSGARAKVRDAALLRGESARARAHALVDDLVPVDYVVEHEVAVHVVTQGPVDVDLAGLARSQEADLLVLGRGETAARLVGLAPCALLVL